MEGFCPLASGSKGNCLYLGSKKTKILIDAGISGKATKTKLAQLDVDFKDIDAILITHEHGDHIYGLKVLALQHNIPILCNSETAKGIYSILRDCPKFKIFTTGEPFEFGDLEINPFSIPHDTMDPVGFTIKVDGLKLGICADLGFATALVEHQLQKCDYLYLESNHEISHVMACRRPPTYKNRVLGRNGHLSNEACGNLLAKLIHENLKHTYLAHLSSECNSPETALKIVGEILKKNGVDVTLSIAPQESLAQTILF
ncbi:MAG: MBL fold metallo-hydrolase [Parachlamydiales bacterium]|nr:MBL fold metallo-hydrolase [Parachlamydiales bacterium]